MTKTGEFERIKRILAPLAVGSAGAFDLTDDAAVFPTEPDRDLVVTTDTMVAGVHFIGTEPPQLIARKLLRVNLSDLAAMGARPQYYTLNIALPSTTEDEWLEQFAQGLEADQGRFGITLAGGDSVSTPGPVTLTVTAIGSVPRGQALRRSGARIGDRILVSGTIGDAAFGLLALTGALPPLPDAARDRLIERYRLPQPRVALGERLTGIAHAAIDVSDGLVADLRHIAETSACGAVLRAAAVPRSEDVRALLQSTPSLQETGLAGGDDYELLFTVAADRVPAMAELAGQLSLPLTEVGEIVDGASVRVLDAAGRELKIGSGGWVHR